MMLTEKEVAIFEQATIYELRLIISQSEKSDYSKQEIMQLFDRIAISKIPQYSV